nr:hypothetical protein [Tanacetum cinerariifolium]
MKEGNELDGISKVLKAVCDDKKLPLAQTWALSGHASFVANSGNIEHSCSSFNRSCIGKVCILTYDLPFYCPDLTTWDFLKSSRERHLENSQGVVGRSFSSRGSWFCRDVTELDEGNYPLVPFAHVSGLASCLAIYITSLELGVAYVIEIFLPTRSTDDADVQRLIKSVKQHIQNASCMQLDIISALQVPQDSEDMEEDIMENEPSNSHAVGTSQNIAPYLEQGIVNFDTNPGTVQIKRKRKRSESSIILEEIKKHFGKTMDDAAAILNGVHTSDGSLAPVFGASNESLGTTTITHDPANLTEKGKHVSPTRTNPPDETIVASRVENVVIKATYGKKYCKDSSFHFD